MRVFSRKKREPALGAVTAGVDDSTVPDPAPKPSDEPSSYPKSELEPDPNLESELEPDPALKRSDEPSPYPKSELEPDPSPESALEPDPASDFAFDSDPASALGTDPAAGRTELTLRPLPASASPHLDDAGVVTEAIEGDMRVLEIEVARSVGVRLLDAPIGPAFNDLTLTGLGPGKEGHGPSLTVSGHIMDSHRGAAVVHGTSRGPGHADFGEPCQDATGCRTLSDDVVAIMAADGVSAGPNSGEVARHAIEFGLAQLPVTGTGSLQEIDLMGWTDALNAELALKVRSIEAEHPGSTGNATTLVLAVVDLVVRSAVVVRVGDASAWVLAAVDTLQPVLSSSKEHDDGLVSGRSNALPSADPRSEGVVVDMADSSAILVCTDGIGDELVTGRSRYARWLSRFLMAPVDPVSYAYAIGMRGRGATDDRGGATCWLPKERR